MVRGWQNGQNKPIHTLTREIAEEQAVSHGDWEQESSRDAAESATGHDPPEPTSGFSLPPFVRTTYVGEEQRARWQPRLEAIWTALAHLRVQAVSRGMLPTSVVCVSPAEVLMLHNRAAEHGLHARLLSSPHPGKRVWMAVGEEEISRRYQNAWEAGQGSVQDELAGVPSCCQQAHRQREQVGWRDPIWSFQQTDEQEIDMRCPPTMNVLLRPLGLDLLGYVPCDAQCEESQRLGRALLALGREVGLTEAIDWLEEILSWPAEWTALHGIAELKTGILKVAYNTDFTPDKRVIRYHGSRLAADAARGLSFAYRKPRPARRALAVQTIVKEPGGTNKEEM
jgi:hypothetical protein